MVHFMFIITLLPSYVAPYVTSVFVCNLYVTVYMCVCMYSYVTRMLLVCTRVLLVCARMLLVRIRMSIVCTRTFSHVCIRMFLVCTRVVF